MVYVILQDITKEDTNLLLSNSSLEASLFRPLSPFLVSSPTRVPGYLNYPESALKKETAMENSNVAKNQANQFSTP